MRFLLVFTLVFVPLAGTLWWSTRREPPPDAPPARPAGLDRPALFGPRDLADARGRTPFHGEILRAGDIEVEVVDGGYVQLYASIDRLARVDDEPRLEEVRLALFDPPVDGRESLRVVLEAPWLTSDASDWIHGGELAPRRFRLAGGVRAVDSAGRVLASIDHLDVDGAARTVRSDARLQLRDPDSGVELAADGFEGRLDLREVELRGEIGGFLPLGAHRARFTARGPAIVREVDAGGPEEPARYRLSCDGEVQVEHPVARARAAGLEASLVRRADAWDLERATLAGPLRVELDPEQAGGLEWIEARSAVLDGRDRWILAGPVRGAAVGPLPLLRAEARAMGEQRYTFEAEGAELRLAESADGADGGTSAGGVVARLREMRFDAPFLARSDDGRTTLDCGTVWLHLGALRQVEVAGGLTLVSPEGWLKAAAASLRDEGEDGVRLQLDGPADVRAEGLAPPDGPLGIAAGGALELTAGERIVVIGSTTSTALDARGGVSIALEGGGALECAALEARLDAGAAGRELGALDATGSVAIRVVRRGLAVDADRLRRLDDGVLELTGTPVEARLKDGRRVEAPVVLLAHDPEAERTTIHASGGVEAVTPLELTGEGEPWTLRCDEAEVVVLGRDAVPASLVASGTLSAQGPDGLYASGRRVTWSRASREAELTGTPAVLRRGDEVRAEAAGFRVRLAERAIERAETIGPATLEVGATLLSGAEAAGGAAGRGAGHFTRVVIDLRGPAVLEGDLVTVAAGAALAGYGDGDAPLLRGAADRVVLVLDPAVAPDAPPAERVLQVVGRGGVRLAGRDLEVAAREMVYDPKTGRVVVQGDARVDGEGWDRTVTWEALEFVLGPDGIDLKRAGRVRVRSKPRE